MKQKVNSSAFCFFCFCFVSSIFSRCDYKYLTYPQRYFLEKLLGSLEQRVQYLTIQSFNVNAGFVAVAPHPPSTHTRTCTHTLTPPLLGYRTSIQQAPSAKPHWAINHIESESSNQSLAFFFVTHIHTRSITHAHTHSSTGVDYSAISLVQTALLKTAVHLR